ncbi:MAG: putative bifunctional diguanylate cyclase/phosphodiesterase, partial [Hyphomicrobiaceae bacterium]
DALTGLANRVHLHERLDQILTGRRRNDGVVALCVDLDQFKDVNDTYGHYVGDALLRAVAQRLQDSVRDADVLARMGGDEFVVLQTAVDSSAAAAALAGRMIDEISAPYELFGHQVTIGVSIGLSVSYEQTVDADELIKQADLALYKAKQDGRGVFRFFEEEMNARLQERRRMERDLRTALSDDQFELYYQPVVNIERDEIAGVEALIRWHHPERGVVSPGEFIPIVEEIGLAGPVGEWVIKQACQDAANWSDDIKIAINVSAAQFRNPGLLDIVKDALSSSGLKSSRLELEITETVLLDDSETTLGILNELRELGVRVAMDDFGTGYASLSYLQKFPFDRIKIDRSFIDEITKDGSAIEIVRTVIALSKGLGMATTAEGVETSDQLTAIVSEGCSDVQGFLVSRPRPRPEIEALFATFDGCRSLGDY